MSRAPFCLGSLSLRLHRQWNACCLSRARARAAHLSQAYGTVPDRPRCYPGGGISLCWQRKQLTYRSSVLLDMAMLATWRIHSYKADQQLLVIKMSEP